MPTPQEFADRWGVSNHRIQQLVADGMPTGSWEDAEAWRAQRKGGVTHQQNKLLADAVDGALTGNTAAQATGLDDEFADEVVKQKQTVKIARAKYHQALRENSKDAPKHYQTLHKAIELLTKTRKELLAHQLATRQLVSRQTALERFRKVLGIVVQAWEQSEVKLAAQANPGDKALALRVYREWRQEVMRKVFANAQAATLSITGEELGNPQLDPVEGMEQPDAGPLGDPGEDGEV